MNPPPDFRYDDSARPRLRVTGGAAARFLHGFCTADVERMAAGDCHEAFFPSDKGRVLGYGLISRHEDRFEVALFAESGDELLAHLNKYALFDPVDVELLDVERTLVGGLEDGDVVVCRWPIAGLVEVDSRGGTAPEADWEGLRVSLGLPVVGVDLTDKNIVQEAARTASAVSFTKGCYLGQEPIARLDAMGHTNKELRVLTFDGNAAVRPGDAVTFEGAAAGQVTSVASQGGRTVALAILKTIANGEGTLVQTGGADAAVGLPAA